MNIASSPSRAPQAKWTVLLYSAADNDLKRFMLADVNEIEAVGSDSYTNLVAQVDTGSQCNRYLLQKDTNMGKINSPVVQALGRQNMSDPQNLADFIKWGVENYPAEHYMVVVSDHGNGWRGAAQDYSHGGWMTLPQIREGFEKAQEATGRKIDVVGFDACLMASTEVAHELQGVADYLVASEETEGGDGWKYTSFLNPTLLQNVQQMHMMKINVEPRQLAIHAVRHAEANQGDLPTMTAVDMSQMPSVSAAVDNLGKAIVGNPNAGQVANLARQAQSYYDYSDVGDFARRIEGSNIPDEGLKTAAKGVTDAIGTAVIAEQHSAQYPGSTGLTLELSRYGVPSGYEETKLAKETSWPQALQTMADASNAAPPKA